MAGRGLHLPVTKRDESQTYASWQRGKAMFQQTPSYSWLSKKSVVKSLTVLFCLCACYDCVLPSVKTVTTPGLKIASVRMQSYLYASHTLPAGFSAPLFECVFLSACLWQVIELILVLDLCHSNALSWVIHLVSLPLIAFVPRYTNHPLLTHTHMNHWESFSWISEWQMMRKWVDF